MLLDRSGKKWTTKIVLSYSVHIFSYTETFQSVHGQRATVICVSTWDVTGGKRICFIWSCTEKQQRTQTFPTFIAQVTTTTTTKQQQHQNSTAKYINVSSL